jgi:hypothetical protein
LPDEYCSRCGQRRLADDHLSLKHFIHEAVVHVGDFEHTKIYRTVVALLIRPGLLTNEYLAGRRADWITPLKLYLTIFTTSFFLYSAFKSVALYDVSTLLVFKYCVVLIRPRTARSICFFDALLFQHRSRSLLRLLFATVSMNHERSRRLERTRFRPGRVHPQPLGHA